MERKNYPDCIYPGKYPNCCYYFDGKCGGHPSFPKNYNYPKYEWHCVQDITNDVQSIKDTNNAKKQRGQMYSIISKMIDDTHEEFINQKGKHKS